MKTFREWLRESEELNEKLIGKLKPYESSLIYGYLDFLKDHFNVQKEVNIILKKPDSKTDFGYIDLISMSRGKYDIVIKYEFGTMLGHIAHEFTHVKQYLKGELDYTPDLNFVIWKKEPFISIKDLSKTTKDLVKYKELPWEAEAYKNQLLLPEKFKKSQYFKNLYQNADATLIFVLDNL
jgi:hypothetical protein